MNGIKKVFRNLKNILPVLLATLFCGAAYAQSFEEIYNRDTNFYSASDYSRISSRKEKQGKSWTVLFYDVGLDSRGGHGDYQLFKDISTNVTSAKLHFLVQTRNSRGNFVRYKLNRGAVTSVFEKKAFSDIRESISSFVQWGKKVYPADRILLAVRGLESTSLSSVCRDGATGQDLMVEDLRQALLDSDVDLDMVIFDTGFTSTLETGYLISPVARYMLGSQDSMDLKSIDYAGMAKLLSMSNSATPSELGKYLIDACSDGEGENGDSHFSLALVDLNRIGAVYGAFVKAADELDLSSGSIARLGGARRIARAVQSFGLYSEKGGRNLLDLADCTILLSGYLPDSSTELLDAIYSAVEYEGHGDMMMSASGLSFFYPLETTAEELDSYAEYFGCGPYLAYLDAVHDFWKAPEWVGSPFGKKSGDKISCLRSFIPERSRMYPVSYTEKNGDNGSSVVELNSGAESVLDVRMNVFYMEEKSGAIVRIGGGSAIGTDNMDNFYGSFTGEVLTMGSYPIFSRLLMSNELYEIYVSPVKHNGIDSGMIICHNLLEDTYRIEGVFGPSKGRNGDALESGDEIQFLFPAQFGTDVKETMMVMGSVLYSPEVVVQKDFLPDGYYMTCFTIYDVFGNHYETVGHQLEIVLGKVIDLRK